VSTKIRARSFALPLLIIISFSCLLGLAIAAGDKKVAVLELVNKASITDDEATFLTDQIRNVASQRLPAGDFTVMTSENIQELLPPGTNLTQCATASCEVEIGRMIGAEYIVTGEILLISGELRVQIKTHHTGSGHFLGSEKTSGGNLNAQEAMLAGVAGAMMSKILSHSGVAPASQPGGGAVFVSPTQSSSPSGAAEVRALAPTEQPPATATGPAGLYITSNPPGADVYLGKTKAGTTSPAFQKVNLQPGTNVRVTIKKNLYHDVAFDVPLKPSVTKFENVELKPAFGSLKIESEPSGAEVLIGGEKVGTTPFSEQRYPSGQYLVTVQKEWYLSQEDQQITVSDGQATTKMFALSQDFGTLDVSSNPSGAQVTLDGKKLGTTPGSWRVPPAQNSKVEVALAKHRGKSFEITINRDQTVTITAEQATLTAKVGSLQVFADPPEPGAKVFVDGKEIGTAPATVSDLIEGAHEVKVETEEISGLTTVNIAEGQTAVATVKLVASTGLKADGEIWIDPTTNLSWKVRIPFIGKDWEGAKKYCERLKLGGHHDWRLPTISELRSLIRGCPTTITGGDCKVTDSHLSFGFRSSCGGCPKFGGPGPGRSYLPSELKGNQSWTWSSSSDEHFAWHINFKNAEIDRSLLKKEFLFEVRCVR
jgi:Protein of unknown function (DUF1566)/PEGA domain